MHVDVFIGKLHFRIVHIYKKTVWAPLVPLIPLIHGRNNEDKIVRHCSLQAAPTLTIYILRPPERDLPPT